MITLLTFLGKSRIDPDTGYKKATYRFPDGRTEQTAFFGLALSDYLAVDATVILGTRGSQWGVLVENLATEGDEEELRITLLDAEKREAVEQSALGPVGAAHKPCGRVRRDPSAHPVRRRSRHAVCHPGRDRGPPYKGDPSAST